MSPMRCMHSRSRWVRAKVPKVSTGGTPDKPRDIWKCQGDKYGSCVVVMQPLPRSRQSLCLVCLTRVVVLPRLSSLSNPPPNLPFPSPALTVKVLRPRAIDSRRGWRFYRDSNVIAKSERVCGGFSQLSMAKNRDTKSKSGRFATVSPSSFYLSRCA